MHLWMLQIMPPLCLKGIMQNYMLYMLYMLMSIYTGRMRHYMRNMRNEGEKYLNKVKVKAYEKDVQIKTEIISSKDISGGILNFAEENNIDLIVIGTRGKSGFKRLLLGSVASHVVTYAHCPMLVVKYASFIFFYFCYI